MVREVIENIDSGIQVVTDHNSIINILKKQGQLLLECIPEIFILFQNLFYEF